LLIDMPAQTVSELHDHLGYWLRLVSNAVSYAFAAKLAGKGVTAAEWVVLRSLYGRGPLPPSRLADDLVMTRGAITKLADRLIAKSLIVRRENRADGRSHTLALTAQGAKIVPELAALADQNDAAFFQMLSATERQNLQALLRRMADDLEITGTPVT
jgi:DNA-binding MarR family transcriptional regulator